MILLWSQCYECSFQGTPRCLWKETELGWTKNFACWWDCLGLHGLTHLSILTNLKNSFSCAELKELCRSCLGRNFPTFSSNKTRGKSCFDHIKYKLSIQWFACYLDLRFIEGWILFWACLAVTLKIIPSSAKFQICNDQSALTCTKLPHKEQFCVSKLSIQM